MSEYKEIIDKMRWSFSRVSTFDTCPYSFYLNYIIADDDLYLSEGNFYGESGSFMHEILEKIFSGEMRPEDGVKYLIDHWDENVCYKVRESTMDKTFEACAEYLMNEDFKWLEDYEVLGVELKVEFVLAGYSFVGYIDLLLRDKRDGKIVVVDHKSAAYPFKQNGEVKKNSEHSFNSYKKQMYLYSYAVKEKYGEFPKEITWNHFKDGGKLATITFDETEYLEAVQWFKDTIHEIEQEENFEAKLDYFFCNTLCNFRNSCEYCAEADWR